MRTTLGHRWLDITTGVGVCGPAKLDEQVNDVLLTTWPVLGYLVRGHNNASMDRPWVLLAELSVDDAAGISEGLADASCDALKGKATLAVIAP